MRFLFSSFFFLFAMSASAEPSAVTMLPKDDLQPFLKEYCIRCHGPEKQKGQVRFDQTTWELTTTDEAQRWQDVLDQLNAGDMPPWDEDKQPTDDELSSVLDSLTGSILLARKALTDHGGEISMRRLNRREYANTIDSLFGFRIPIDRIPEDGEAATFDTVGAEQFFTSAHFEKYLDLGREIAAQGIHWAGRPRSESKTSRREPESRVTDRYRTTLADLDNKMRMKNEGKTWKEMGFKDEGEAEIIFSQFDSRAGKPRAYLQLPHIESGIYFSEVNNETRRIGANHGGSDPRADYRLRARAGIHGEPPGVRRFLRFLDHDGIVGVLKVRGTADAPEIIELPYRPEFDSRNVNFNIEENRADIPGLDFYLRRLKIEGQPAAIWVDWLETEGPFYPADRSFFETLLFPEAPQRGKRNQIAWDQENIRLIVESFAYQAFRHETPAPEFIDRLMEYFYETRGGGSSFQDALTEVLAIILASPQFLFLQEAGGTDTQEGRMLDQREFAVRLAYFLWSSPPDEALFREVEAGRLFQPKVLRSQVERMLDDSRADSFVDGFASQWAEMDRFDAITVNESDFFLFNKGIRHSARLEVVEFFKTLITENLSVTNLIDSDFIKIDPVLAEHYGLPELKSNQFQKVTLPADSPRGGMLGQTAFLTLGSNGERSSPVIRGAFVMEKLLHDKPAPPPPNVPELGSSSKKPVTNREMVVLHQSQAVCASCHRKMDVIGFGLENFDPIGKWRDVEMVGRKEVPIDPAGKLPGGPTFESIAGLKEVLIQQKAGLAKEVTESLLAYALGRTVEFSDADDVEEILSALKADDYLVREMIHQIAGSNVFRTR